jgi:EAL domain-containing protein (putative c-di-GMP-specific phosphodiesterase class I)/ActR/RegA family two-component response regulator
MMDIAQRHMRALVVDDEPFVLKLLVRQLERLGLGEIVSFERARDALALLETDAANIDIIFSDLQMPGMDGVEFVRQIVNTGYAGRLVIVSGEDQRVLAGAARLAKVQGLHVLGALHKPASTEQLRERLDNGAAGPAQPVALPRKMYGKDELAAAIKNGQLLNYYQPKVATSTGAFVGVEALVRWQHPEDGLVLPDQFVGTAEQHGLIDDLTRAVLSAALQQTRLWLDAGTNLQVAVNVSMANLNALDFPDSVEAAAMQAGVSLSSLILEVTESRLMSDSVAPLDVLTRLRLRRVGLAIDDFGTGHSSLAQLRDLPFDELKIDGSFLRGASNDASAKAIVEASVQMARQLGMKTVGEGIEGLNDWNFLRECGCEVAQGYFVGRPMRPSDIPAWLAEWETRRETLAGPI